MKLVHIPSNSARTGKPFLAVSIKGVMRLSSAAVEQLKLKPGDSVSFFQDQDSPEDWYLKIGGDIITRSTGKDNSSLLCNSAGISNLILKSVNKNKSVQVPLGTEPVEEHYYALITSALKPKS